MTGATRLVLGSAILSLCWPSPGLPRAALAKGVPTTGVGTSPNGNGRCNSPPCSCDQYGRLTCECTDHREELILTAEGEGGLGRHTSRIVVNNCPSVLLTNSSLAQMDGLISVDLINVANLTLMQHSFKLSQKAANTRITVRNSSLEVLPSNVFHGDVEAIVLENVRIGRVLAFSFANLINSNSITLENCEIKVLEALAFKKFDARFFHVIGGSFGDQVPSRVMNDIEVYDKFMLDGVRMGIVRSSAFVIKRPKTVAILNCDIENLESEAFDISVRGTVIIKNNTLGNVAFGAFFSIRADTENNQIPSASGNLYNLMFKNNSLNSFEEGSLIFDRKSFRAEINSVLVNQVCECNQLSIWKSQILNYTNAYSRLMTYRENTNVLAPPFSLESSAEDPETFLCLENTDAESTLSFVEFETRNCAFSNSILLLISMVSGFFLLLVIAVCLLVYYCCKYRRHGRKRWISVPTLAPDVVTKAQNGVINREDSPTGETLVDSRITMVVPDGRLYKETEFHVIVEKAEPLTTEL